MHATRIPLLALLAVLSVPVLAAGCGDDLGECPDNSATQQAQGLEVLETKCQTCHSSKVTGGNRLGAPSDLNFDDDSTVADEAGEMYGEVEDGSMPPGGGLSDADKEALRVYLACHAE